MAQVVITGDDLSPEQLMQESDDPMAAMAADPDIGNEPVTSNVPGVPTYDDLTQMAAAGMNQPDPSQMMGGLNPAISQGGIQYSGMQKAEQLLLFDALTGEPRPVHLYWNAGRQVHDAGIHYRRKRFLEGDANVPAELWGKHKLLLRPPLNPPLKPKGVETGCEFCPKTGFPTELERRKHMQVKHKSEYAEARRDIDESNAAEDRSIMRELMRANTDAITVLANPAGRDPTEAELRLAGKIAAEVADQESESTTEIGQWCSLKDAMTYYRLGRTKLILDVENGDLAGHKDDKGRWRVFIPSTTWKPEGAETETPEKAATGKEGVSIS